jgi:pimeloyl-ACP methyl ester carboxylesterase
MIALVILAGCGNPPSSPEVEADQPPAVATETPAAAFEHSTAAGDGVAIASTETGSGSPALVFIHGWMCNQSFWLPQTAHFASTNTVVTIDLPGHGRSGMDREGWPLMAFGDDVRRVIEDLDLDRVILIGHSMGAPVALETARLIPERVIGVVAVDSLKNVEWQFDAEQKKEFMESWERNYGATCASFVSNMFPRSADPELVKRVHRDMCGAPAAIALTIMRQFLDYDGAAALAAVDVPVRCINSAASPTSVETNRAYHADFDAVELEGVGHFLMMERPDEFNEHLTAIIEELSAGE